MDRKGEEFPVIRDCGTCRSVVLNGKKLYWMDRREDWKALGLYALRLLFTTGKSQGSGPGPPVLKQRPPFEPGGCTRGCICEAWNEKCAAGVQTGPYGRRLP